MQWFDCILITINSTPINFVASLMAWLHCLCVCKFIINVPVMEDGKNENTGMVSACQF